MHVLKSVYFRTNIGTAAAAAGRIGPRAAGAQGLEGERASGARSRDLSRT
jgi:hypothetical protein